MAYPTVEAKVYLGLYGDPSDIIINGDFEDVAGDDFADWTEVAQGTTTIEDETTVVHGDSHAVKFTRNSDYSICYIAQTIEDVAEEHTHSLSFYSKCGPKKSPLYYYVYDYTDDVLSYIISGKASSSTDWTLNEVEFITPNGCDTLYIQFSTSYVLNNINYLDDVVVYDYGGRVYTKNEDVLSNPNLIWEYGISGTGPEDLVADTGIATFILDNRGVDTPETLYSPPAETSITVLNPGFETLGAGGADVFANWTELLGSDGVIEDGGPEVHGGSHSAHMTVVSSGISILYQGLSTEVNTVYTAKSWVKGDWGFLIYGDGPVNWKGGTTTDWTQKQIVWTGSSTTDDLYLLNDNYFTLFMAPDYPYDGYFDDVTVTYTGSEIPYASGSTTAGLYSPGNDNCILGFEEGMPMKITLTPTIVNPTNLLENPSFEISGSGASTFDSWTEGGTSVLDETTTVYSGSHSCRLTYSGSQPYVKQEETLILGKNYTLTFWQKGDIECDFLTTTDYKYSGDSSVDWEQKTLSFTATSTDGEVWFYNEEGETGYVDAVSLTTNSNEVDKFIGSIVNIEPNSDRFSDPTVDIEAHDWMGYLTKQELGLQAVVEDKTADEALTVALAEFPNQPDDTDFDTGVEEFLLVFNTDDSTESMARFFQKMARNELGRIYVEGDGTLVFESRDARPLTTASSFTINGEETEFDISYSTRNIYNIISSTVIPTIVDSAATTVLWEVGDYGIPIKGNETITLRCSFRDPDTGESISAIDVVDPIATGQYKFGSSQVSTSDDLHANLSQSNTVGATSISCELTNTGSADGYLNEFNVQGKGIYQYNKITLETSDFDSIFQVGESRYLTRLEQINNPTTAYNYAAFIKGNYAPSHINTCRIKICANQSDALMTGLIEAEPSTRFTVVDDITGVNQDFYINKLTYQVDDTLLWVTIEAQASITANAFIWDSFHWDSEEDGRWML